MKETTAINRSLFMLGKVIAALAEGAQARGPLPLLLLLLPLLLLLLHTRMALALGQRHQPVTHVRVCAGRAGAVP